MADEPSTAEIVDAPAEEVPVPVTDPPEPEQEPHSEPDHDDKVIGAIDAMGNKIIEALGTLKEASPVTEPTEEILDESPVKKPWTHRSIFRK